VVGSVTAIRAMDYIFFPFSVGIQIAYGCTSSFIFSLPLATHFILNEAFLIAY
jgi:hypothetical protein